MFPLIKAKLIGAKRSVTIWFNSLALTLISGLPSLEDLFPKLSDYIPQGIFHYAMAVIIIANILLRFKTTVGLDKR